MEGRRRKKRKRDREENQTYVASKTLALGFFVPGPVGRHLIL